MQIKYQNSATTVLLFFIFIHLAKGIYHTSQLNRAINYLQSYNRLSTKSVVLLTSPFSELENDTFYEEFVSMASERHKNTFLLYISMKGNTSNALTRIQSTMSPSIIILYDFESWIIPQKNFFSNRCL